MEIKGKVHCFFEQSGTQLTNRSASTDQRKRIDKQK
jgi:hypothetical protein